MGVLSGKLVALPARFWKHTGCWLLSWVDLSWRAPLKEVQPNRVWWRDLHPYHELAPDGEWEIRQRGMAKGCISEDHFLYSQQPEWRNWSVGYAVTSPNKPQVLYDHYHTFFKWRQLGNILLLWRTRWLLLSRTQGLPSHLRFSPVVL